MQEVLRLLKLYSEDRYVYVFLGRETNNSKIVEDYFNHMIYILYTWNNKAFPIMYETWNFFFLSPKMYCVAIIYVEQDTSKVSALK